MKIFELVLDFMKCSWWRIKESIHLEVQYSFGVKTLVCFCCFCFVLTLKILFWWFENIIRHEQNDFRMNDLFSNFYNIELQGNSYSACSPEKLADDSPVTNSQTDHIQTIYSLCRWFSFVDFMFLLFFTKLHPINAWYYNFFRFIFFYSGIWIIQSWSFFCIYNL